MIKLKNKQKKAKKEMKKKLIESQTIKDENILAISLMFIAYEFMYYFEECDYNLLDHVEKNHLKELIDDNLKLTEKFDIDFSNVEARKEYKKIRGWLKGSVERTKELNKTKNIDFLLDRLARLVKEQQNIKQKEVKFYINSDRDIKFYMYVSTFYKISSKMLLESNLDISTIKYIKNFLKRLESLLNRFEAYMKYVEDRDILKRELSIKFEEIDYYNSKYYYHYLQSLSKEELNKESETLEFLKTKKTRAN